MASVKCTECGATVSTSARSCPACGYSAIDKSCSVCASFDYEECECNYTSDKGPSDTACPHFDYNDND